MCAALAAVLLAAGCSAGGDVPQRGSGPVDGAAADARPEWAIALHGGAGGIPTDTPSEEVDAYRRSLVAALELGRDLLESGSAALDVVERVVRSLEDDPQFNAGRGAVFDASGRHQLDASIMDGSTLACGAVAATTTVRHPITLARRVMTETRHVLLAADGAERFADEQGVERVENSWFSTERRRESFEKLRRERGSKRLDDAPAASFGTVGVVALDRNGDLAAGTSTGGLTGKRWGRIGDSPIVGAGTYASNDTCAVSGTGTGEEFIRHGVARRVASLMEDAGLGVAQAAERVIFDVLDEGVGGVIALGADGTIAMPYNTDAMFRGAATSAGRFEVFVWEEALEAPAGGGEPL